MLEGALCREALEQAIKIYIDVATASGLNVSLQKPSSE